MTKKMMVKSIAAFLLLQSLVICFSSCSDNKYNLSKNKLQIVKADGQTVVCNAELAKKEEERNYGFMNRKNIPDGTGMLFIFEKDQVLSFWMKNTPHPLSIAYIDSKGIIKNIYDMTPYSTASIVSTVSVRYALEVPQGWFDKMGIKVGDKVITEDGSSLKGL